MNQAKYPNRFAVFLAFPGLNLTPKASAAENQLNSVGTSDVATQNKLLADTNATTSQFEGPIDQSPYYKAMLSAGTSATTGAYKGAQAAVRARANAAGYGTSPVGTGAQDQVSASEAHDLSQLPSQSLIAATQPALESAGITAGEQQTYNPNNPLSSAASLSNQRSQIGRSFLSSLVNAGTKVATSFA